MARHVHADLIHAWADGAEIQAKVNSEEWIGTQNPTWHPTNEYRIKPRTVKKVGWVRVVKLPSGQVHAALDVFGTEAQARQDCPARILAVVPFEWTEEL